MTNEMPKEIWVYQIPLTKELVVHSQRVVNTDKGVKYHRDDIVQAKDAEIQRLREALTEAKSLLELSDYNGDRAKNIKDEPLDSLIKKICEKSGYGAVMDSAARQWFLKDKSGSITTGACSGSIRVVMHKIEQTLKGQDK